MKSYEQLYNELKNEFKSCGIDCEWMMETGGIKVNKNETVKLTFSLRDHSTFKQDVEKMKELVGKKLTNYKISGSNQFDTCKPEYRFIVTINQ